MKKPLRVPFSFLSNGNYTVGILGYGEAGKAIAKLYKKKKVLIKDLDRDDGLEQADVLSITVPWRNKKQFETLVRKEIKAVRPYLTLIHSSVPPGTTKRIISSLPKELRQVVHSPLRGVHPDLYKGLKTFVKYVGAEEKNTGNLAGRHLKSLGLSVEVFIPAATTELGKMLSTTYYGLMIAWHGEMKRLCKEVGVEFHKAATHFNKTYNMGYKGLGILNVIRPVLYPPEGGIGGHCVIPNAKILRGMFRSPALDFVLTYTPKHKHHKRKRMPSL